MATQLQPPEPLRSSDTPPLPSWIAAVAVTGAASFATSIAALDATTHGYSPVREVASQLSLTSHADVMRSMLVIFGMTQVVFGFGIRRSLPGPAVVRRTGGLLVVFGFAFAIGGLVNMDPGTTVRTVHGALHDAAAATGLVALTASAAQARAVLRQLVARVAASTAAAVTLPLLVATEVLPTVAGAIQRVMLAVDLIYIIALAVGWASLSPLRLTDPAPGASRGRRRYLTRVLWPTAMDLRP